MTELEIQEAAIPISIAIRSLYQMVVLVEEGNFLCHVIDCDKEVENLLQGGEMFLDMMLESFCRNIHPAHREDFRDLTDSEYIHDRLSKEVFISTDCQLRYADSSYYWSRITICNAKILDSPEGREYLLLLQNIHKEKQKEIDKNSLYIKQICRLQSDYDKLYAENMMDEQTRCFNRKGLTYYETIVLNKAKQDGKALFVCVLDLNGLKYLNDTYGHSAGDEAIRAVADALRCSAPERACIVRTGGDEFLVLAALDKESRQPEQMEILLDQLLKKYNDDHDNLFSVGASYGWILEEISEETESIESFVEEADKRMYEMKVKRDEHMR